MTRSSILLRAAAAAAILALLLLLVFASRRQRTTGPPPVDPPADEKSEPAYPDASALEIDRVQDAPLRTPAEARSQAPPRPTSTTTHKVRLVGDVRDADGRPISVKSAVIVYRTSTSTLTHSIQGGAYRIGGLDPGPVGMDCLVLGYAPQSRKFVIGPEEVEHREDFVLQPLWTVDVVVRTSDGGNVVRTNRIDGLAEDAVIELAVSESAPPRRWIGGTRDMRRVHRLVQLKREGFQKAGFLARVAILLEPPVYLSVDVSGFVLASARLDARVDRTTLVIPAGVLRECNSSLACRIVDAETGTPIEDAQVTLLRPDGGMKTSSPVNDGPGRKRWHVLAPGRCGLTVSSDGRSKVTRWFDLEPGIETDLGTIALDRSVRIRGRFVDRDGRFLTARECLQIAGGIRVAPYSPEELWRSTTWVPLDLDVEPDGTFESGGFGRDLYLLRAGGRPNFMHQGAWMIRSTMVDCRGGSVDDLVVTLDRARPLSIRPEVDDAKDLGYWIVEDGVPCREGDLAGARTEYLPSGKYRLLVGPDAANVREIPFTIGEEPLLIPIEP